MHSLKLKSNSFCLISLANKYENQLFQYLFILKQKKYCLDTSKTNKAGLYSLHAVLYDVDIHTCAFIIQHKQNVSN